MIIVPIFFGCNNDDDVPPVDLDGIGKILLILCVISVLTILLTYYIIGSIHGFDAWGLISISSFIGMMGSLIVYMLWEIVKILYEVIHDYVLTKINRQCIVFI